MACTHDGGQVLGTIPSQDTVNWTAGASSIAGENDRLAGRGRQTA
jgi:hypothetical protein